MLCRQAVSTLSWCSQNGEMKYSVSLDCEACCRLDFLSVWGWLSPQAAHLRSCSCQSQAQGLTQSREKKSHLHTPLSESLDVQPSILPLLLLLPHGTFHWTDQCPLAPPLLPSLCPVTALMQILHKRGKMSPRFPLERRPVNAVNTACNEFGDNPYSVFEPVNNSAESWPYMQEITEEQK